MKTTSTMLGGTLLPVAMLAVLLPSVPAAASSGGQGAYLSSLWSDARQRGVPRSLFDDAFEGFKISPQIMELTGKQPERVSTVGDYVNTRVGDKRIETGRLKLEEWSGPLGQIRSAYGVPAEILAAIWGIETNYGSFVGGSNVVHSLATLAHEGYREKYFRGELMVALEILRDGHITPDRMLGSWAGAMGQTQFMPSSFTTFAVDFDGDGRSNIWTSIPDALASSANYLKENGWRHGETWGYEVKLPGDLDYAKVWSEERRPLSEWQRLGIVRVDGNRYPRIDDQARLYLPMGGGGPAFLVLRNFDVIKRYNNSDSYALAVGHLADRLANGKPFATAWPDAQPLSSDERRELQNLLVGEGFYSGDVNGRIGPQTKKAIAAFQMQQSMRADAFPTKRLLQILRVRSQSSTMTE
ncbi:MAG: lytic murein transglycosylase [Mesorhizobium sp.]|nr:lytic murein transglycosylase [Mesorhizobium sp.]MBL8579865.1 lytic murein transglycosylase [Mesorhizobium sp.]